MSAPAGPQGATTTPSPEVVMKIAVDEPNEPKPEPTPEPPKSWWPNPWLKYRTDKPGIFVFILLTLVVIGVCFVVVGPVYNQFKNDASYEKKVDKQMTAQTACLYRYTDGRFYDTKDNATTGLTTASNAMAMWVTVQLTKLTALENSIKVVIDFGYLPDDISKPTYLNVPVLNLNKTQKLVVQTNTQKKEYKHGDPMTKIEENLILMQPTGSNYATYTFYPFDKYSALLQLNVHLDTTANDTTISQPIEVCYSVDNAVAGFEMPMQDFFIRTFAEDVYSPDKDDTTQVESAALASIIVKRTNAIRFFSIFIVIIMWSVTGFFCALTLDHLVLRPREPSGAVGTVTGLLFALGGVRNCQPDVPPVGAAVDMLSYIWCMGLAGACASFLYAAQGGMYKLKPKEEKK